MKEFLLASALLNFAVANGVFAMDPPSDNQGKEHGWTSNATLLEKTNESMEVRQKLSLNVVKYLVEKREGDVEAKVKAKHDMTPLHIVFDHGHLDIAKYLIKAKHDMTPLHIVFDHGHLDIAKYLSKK